MGKVSGLYRYPVKGFTAQPLTEVAVMPAAGFPKDRFYAFSKGTLQPSDYEAAPRPKTDFLMLLLHEQLAKLDAKFDDGDDDRLSLSMGGKPLFSGSLTQAEDVERLEQFIAAFMNGKVSGQPKLLRIEGRQFTDVAVTSEAMMRAVSLINLKSVRVLEEAVGAPVDPLRFRANIYFEGDNPWEEFDWIGKEVRIGPAGAVGVLRTKRCGATNVNPATAERDRNLPAALVRAFNHPDMGIYVEMKEGADIALGDVIALA
ncbi:Sulfurase [Methylocella tundrae]|uniref:Sulfurase n=1 Tax=Methylocella tundrae TaxID=227605 RepID=A0A8B6MB97_METTU|nr:MOSC domain-containing protein [Methylocella tundrae]VTZ27288.1 Sulfurase [Methylocella tundrae]VTZ52273.1 Sulfurase [Methylocella tundrae]